MFSFPSSPADILLKKKSLRRQLLGNTDSSFLNKRIAILGGSTTNEFKDCFELYLLASGIKAEFYQSEFDKFYEDSVFGNPELKAFNPELIVLFTSVINIRRWPEVRHSLSEVQALATEEFERFRICWEKLSDQYICPVIQNNFELPSFRLFGNADFTDHRGRVSYVNTLNAQMSQAASTCAGIYIHDLCYDAACYGLDRWHDRSAWHAYKLAFTMEAIPFVARSTAGQVSALFGLSRKCLVVDLDNTLWGGVIGDDGVHGINLGTETSVGAAHIEFQQYILRLHERGVLLAVCSKNEHDNAVEGLNHPEGALHAEHFDCIVANWDPKDKNISKIANALNIGLDSLVFVDDNPVERDIVRKSHPQVIVPEVGDNIEEYLSKIDKGGYFEIISVLDEDLNRARMYKQNSERNKFSEKFNNYQEYLISLQMEAEISPFREEYFDRIYQLINKTNQFNLTTKRCSREEVVSWSNSLSRITLFGRLVDKFGDNGLTSIVTADVQGTLATIDIWLMSCRVIKRGLELAMMEALVHEALRRGVKELRATYKSSKKNRMVQNLLEILGFSVEKNHECGDSEWRLELPGDHTITEHFIKIKQ